MHKITNNMSFADLESELRNKADECHNNNGNRTWEDWERMNSFLLAAADRIKEFRVNELPEVCASVRSLMSDFCAQCDKAVECYETSRCDGGIPCNAVSKCVRFLKAHEVPRETNDEFPF